MKNHFSIRVAIVGATGAVGREFLRLVDERRLDVELRGLAASERSSGRVVRLQNVDHPIRTVDEISFEEIDVAFFSAGSAVSRAHVPRAVAQGALVIDNSSAFRLHPDTPLVVPQVNAHELYRGRPASSIIAIPNSSTIPLVRLLDPVNRLTKVRSVIASTYQAASGAGLSGVDELDGSVRAALEHPADRPFHHHFAAPLGYNVVPSIEALQTDGFTFEEQKIVHESRKILSAPDMHISATCVRVPVRNCHSAAVYVRCEAPIDPDTLKALWRDSAEVRVYDGNDTEDVPSPRMVGSSDLVHVGRIRRDPLDRRAFWIWVVSDNIRVGAALTAVQVAEVVIAQNVFDVRNRHRGLQS